MTRLFKLIFRNINFAPKKKRIHSDVTAVIIGDTKKALFRSLI